VFLVFFFFIVIFFLLEYGLVLGEIKFSFNKKFKIF
jgi:hypothetical protein